MQQSCRSRHRPRLLELGPWEIPSTRRTGPCIWISLNQGLGTPIYSASHATNITAHIDSNTTLTTTLPRFILQATTMLQQDCLMIRSDHHHLHHAKHVIELLTLRLLQSSTPSTPTIGIRLIATFQIPQISLMHSLSIRRQDCERHQINRPDLLIPDTDSQSLSSESKTCRS